LAAKSEELRDEWVKTLHQSIQHAIKRQTTIKKAINNDIVSLEKKGYLMKKQKKRFFVLRDLNLSWYETEKMEKLKGKITISECTILQPDEHSNIIIIKNPRGKNYSLQSEFKRDCDEWFALLQQSSTKKKATRNGFGEKGSSKTNIDNNVN